MANYTVQDSASGKNITFQWNGKGPPTEEDMTHIAGVGAAPQEPAKPDNGRVDGVPKWGRDNPNIYAGVMTALDLAPAAASFAKTSGIGIPVAGAINAASKSAQRAISGEDWTPTVSDFVKGATIEGAGRGIGKIAEKITDLPMVKNAIGKAADKFTDMTLKQGTTLSRAKRLSNIQTAHEGSFLPNTKGVDKLENMISQTENKIIKGMETGDNANIRGSFDKAIFNLENLRADANVSSDPIKNNAMIDDEIYKLINHPMVDVQGTVKISDMQRMKVNQGREIANSYGEQKPQFANTIDKARVRGLKEELEDKLGTHFPELKDTNQQLSKYYDLRKVLTRAANRIENNQGIGIGLPIKGGAGATIGGMLGGPTGAAIGGGIGTAAGIAEHPAVAPRIGQGLYRASKSIPNAPELKQFGKMVNSIPVRGAFDAAILADPLGLRQ